MLNRAISTFLIKQAGLKMHRGANRRRHAHTTFWVRRDLNIHLHCLFLDGVYCTTDEGPVFQPVKAPSVEQLQTLLNQIIKRVMKLLTRQGYLVEEQEMLFMADTDTDTAMAPLQSAACTYRIALGPRAGQKVVTLGAVPRFEAQPAQQRCAKMRRGSASTPRCAAP